MITVVKRKSRKRGRAAAPTSLCSTWVHAIGCSSLGWTSFWHIRHSLQVAGACTAEEGPSKEVGTSGSPGLLCPWFYLQFPRSKKILHHRKKSSNTEYLHFPSLGYQQPSWGDNGFFLHSTYKSTPSSPTPASPTSQFSRKESYMWRPPRIWNLGRRQEHWGTDLGEWSRVQGPDPTKWLWAETLSESGRNICVTGHYQKEIIHFSARRRKKAGQIPLAAMLLLTPNFSEICLLLQHLNRSAAAAKSLQSCPTLCDPIDGSPPGSPAPGILQARTPEWAAISFTGLRSPQIAFLTWVLAATRSCSASRAATSWISSSMVRPAIVVRAVLICWRMLVIWALRKREIEGEKFCATLMGNIYETSPILTHKYFSGKHFLN